MSERGVIKWYNLQKKFGFIVSLKENKEIFFHINDFPVGITPKDQMTVEYEIGKDKQGREKAIKIVCVCVGVNENEKTD